MSKATPNASCHGCDPELFHRYRYEPLTHVSPLLSSRAAPPYCCLGIKGLRYVTKFWLNVLVRDAGMQNDDIYLSRGRTGGACREAWYAKGPPIAIQL